MGDECMQFDSSLCGTQGYEVAYENSCDCCKQENAIQNCDCDATHTTSGWDLVDDQCRFVGPNVGMYDSECDCLAA